MGDAVDSALTWLTLAAVGLLVALGEVTRPPSETVRASNMPTDDVLPDEDEIEEPTEFPEEPVPEESQDSGLETETDDD